jgi:hypothetical protein
MLAKDNLRSPERRAVDRIKRKASGLSAEAAIGHVALEDIDEATAGAGHGVEPARARCCRCAEAEIKAYRDADEWVCHTCGRQPSPYAIQQLEERVRRIAAG